MSFFIVSLSHVTQLRLVMVKIFHRKLGILNHTELPLFYRISVASSEGFRMPPFNHVSVLSTLGARDSSCAASLLVSSAEGRRRVSLRPTKLLVTREKKSLVPRGCVIGNC